MSGSGDRRGGGPPGSGEHLPLLRPSLCESAWSVACGWTVVQCRVGFRVAVPELCSGKRFDSCMRQACELAVRGFSSPAQLVWITPGIGIRVVI